MSNHEPSPAIEKIAQVRQEFFDTLRRVFDSPDGTSILAWLHSAAATRKPSFLPGGNGAAYDPIAAAIRDGRKSIVLEIEENLQAARRSGDAKPKAVAPSRVRRRGT